MEGKEVRFGIAQTSVFANSTTAASCGAVNASHDSLTPLAGGMAMLNIALGEIVFGGVGSGLYGMLIFAILAVFIAGLMVGRTPEYLGKKIGPTDMKLAMLSVLALEAGILVIAGISVVYPPAASAVLNAGSARALGDALRGDLGGGEQRLGVRRAHGLRDLLHDRAVHRHVRRTLLLHHPGPGHRGLHGPEEGRTALLRHVPHRQARCSSACSSA